MDWQESVLATVLSFINCEKYPPSLLYLMMTLGPALLFLAAFDRMRGRFADVVATFGRVPFFYHVAHLYFIHVFALVAAWWSTGRGGLALEWASAEQARRLWLWPCGNLRGLARGGGRALSGVPLVCRSEAAQPSMVVELPLGHVLLVVRF